MQSSKSKAVLLLGSNLGNSEEMLINAAKLIELQAGKIINKSAFYRTAPWGNVKQPAFLNQAIIIETKYSAKNLLPVLLQIEEKLGRVRTEKWEARIIDIDILFFDNEVIEDKNLKIPHPFLHKRKFTLLPLIEIMPNYLHPTLNKTITELSEICDDNSAVEKYTEA